MYITLKSTSMYFIENDEIMLLFLGQDTILFRFRSPQFLNLMYETLNLASCKEQEYQVYKLVLIKFKFYVPQRIFFK